MSEEEKLALVDNLSAELKFNYRRILLQKARMGRSVVMADACQGQKSAARPAESSREPEVNQSSLPHRPISLSHGQST